MCSLWFKGLTPVLKRFVVTMHEGACEIGSQIPRALALTYCSQKPESSIQNAICAFAFWAFFVNVSGEITAPYFPKTISRKTKYCACFLSWIMKIGSCFEICFSMVYYDIALNPVEYNTYYNIQCVPDISRSFFGYFSPNNSRKTPIARPSGRGMGAFGAFEVWPKFYLWSVCALCYRALYCTAMYRRLH